MRITISSNWFYDDIGGNFLGYVWRLVFSGACLIFLIPFLEKKKMKDKQIKIYLASQGVLCGVDRAIEIVKKV